jgi:4-hydroxy-tetrahydrodipicolinate reductase
MKNLDYAINSGINVVVGTTGFDSKKIEEVKALLAKNPQVGAIIAPNFGLGAVLMMQFAAKAAGTATRTAELISDARAKAKKSAMPDKTSSALAGARGAKVGDVPIHSVRLRGLVAHQEVLLGDQGETLSIRHDSIDRSGFMPGVLLAIRSVSTRPGLTFGLENLMDI